MSPDQCRKVEELYEHLASLRADQHRALLDQLCPEDSQVRDEVLTMLRRASSTAPADPVHSAPAMMMQHDNLIGSTIGPYRILELLGDGGMGSVYKAEQRSPVKRIVALKLIKSGFDTREVIARFDTERQALARMDHPNIAKVLDGGSTDTGRPYFVMEYVAAVPITKFADDNKLSIKQRLRLFTQACEAISHAHTKAIIHRDIKASNVLAYLHDGKPTVKVIDFGIAKALTSDRLSDLTFNTSQGMVIGTYEYMSPEQAAGSPDIDTRTDVYSLGVLLYELLAGARPFERATLIKAGDEEMRRVIRDEEPPKPSTRLSGLTVEDATRIAALRQTHVEQLAREFRKELEWIPLKSIRKERGRRYDSPLQLAEDIANYLEGRPLRAGPETRRYRLKKWVSKHRAGVLTVTTFTVLSCVAVALYVSAIRAEQLRTTREKLKTEAALTEVTRQRQEADRQREEADRQRSEAERRREESETVVKFLTDDMLAGVRPANVPDRAVRDTIVRTMIDPAARRVGAQFADKPLIEAAIRDALAVTYHAVGRADLGLPHAQAALTLRRRVLGDDHPDTLQSISNMGTLLQAQGKLAEAEPLYREALERSRRVLGDDHPSTLVSMSNMGYLLRTQGKLAEAEPLYREALERSRRVLGDDHPDTLGSINNMGAVLQAQGKLAEAEPLYREALERSRRVLGDDHPDTLGSINNMGDLLQAQGKLTEAEPLFREALERSRRVLGDDHPQTLTSINNMGGLLEAQGKLAEAEPLLREALERCRRVLGDDHPDTLLSINNMGNLLEAQGKPAEAQSLLREALERSRRVLGDDHPNTLASMISMGYLLQAQGKLAEAEPLLREALERFRRVLGDDHPNTLVSINNMGGLLQAQGKLAEAEPLFREALERSRRVLGDDHPDTLASINNMGSLLQSQGKLAEAEPLFREAMERAAKNPSLGKSHPHTKTYASNLAKCLASLGKDAEADAIRREYGIPAPATQATQPSR